MTLVNPFFKGFKGFNLPVCKGGAFNYSVENCTSASKWPFISKDKDIGFRIVLSLKKEALTEYESSESEAE